MQSKLEELVCAHDGGYLCHNNGLHWSRDAECAVCAEIEKVRGEHANPVKIYGTAGDAMSRLLAICKHGHVFYTSIYMMKNIVACGNMTKQPVTRHNRNCHNHIFSEYVDGIENWSRQAEIKIKRMLQLILHYISIGGFALNGKVIPTHQILWQDDMCPAGNVIACNHLLRYVVTYAHDCSYVDVSDWCKVSGYHLIKINHCVSSQSQPGKRTKSTNLDTMMALAVGLHDAGILKSYNNLKTYKCNVDVFLKRFVKNRHIEFTQLGTKIIEKNHSIFATVDQCDKSIDKPSKLDKSANKPSKPADKSVQVYGLSLRSDCQGGRYVTQSSYLTSA
jgi:hypothetical protein